MSKNWNKSYSVATAIIAVIFVILCAFGLSANKVDGDFGNLEEKIIELYDGGTNDGEPVSVEICCKEQIGDQTVLILEIDHRLGYAILTDAPGDKYRLEGIGYGDGKFADGVLSTEGKKYLWFGGRNTGGDIAGVQFELSQIAYEMEIPQEDFFLVYTEIDEHTAEEHMVLDKVVLLDADGKDITQKYR